LKSLGWLPNKTVALGKNHSESQSEAPAKLQGSFAGTRKHGNEKSLQLVNFNLVISHRDYVYAMCLPSQVCEWLI